MVILFLRLCTRKELNMRSIQISTKLRIISEKVVYESRPDHVLGERPEEFSSIVNKCAVLNEFIRTGKQYEVAD